MPARTAALALVLCSLAAAAAPASAQVVHRWVDERGVVQYGDRPLGTTGTTLRIRAESATAPSAAGTSIVQAPRPAKPPPAAPKTSTIDSAIAAQRTLNARPGTAAAAPNANTPGMAALVAECKAHRGVDCETPQGMRRLQQENTPLSREEQARIAGVRARRAACARTPGTLGC